MATHAGLALNGGRPVVDPGRHGTWPDIRAEDIEAVTKVLERGALSGARTPAIVGLEKEWAYRCGVAHCVATNSGTAALHCAVVGLDIQPGDEVVVPAVSFVASAFAVAHHGAVPVFADVDPETCALDPARVAELCGERTRAVLAVHLHGVPADMEALTEVAVRRGLPVIEDAAQAHGARYRERPVGQLGSCAAFSLNVTKGLVGGEGGLLVTDDDRVALAARRLALFGEDVERRVDPRGPTYHSQALGWNYRCSPLAAALARTQLRRLDEVNACARTCADILTSGLSEIPGLLPPRAPDGCTPVWNKYRVRFDREAFAWDGSDEELRDWFVRALQAEGVAASLWQDKPLPAHPAFRRGGLRPWRPADGPVADAGLEPWDPNAFPAATQILRASFLLGSERMPLGVQAPELMHDYVEAVAKVAQALNA